MAECRMCGEDVTDHGEPHTLDCPGVRDPEGRTGREQATRVAEAFRRTGVTVSNSRDADLLLAGYEAGRAAEEERADHLARMLKTAERVIASERARHFADLAALAGDKEGEG